jgi:hypothetical protein
MSNPDQTPRQGPAEQGSEAALRQFVDARNAYFSQLNEGWQAARKDATDACSAHAKKSEALAQEWQQGVTEAARRYGEGVRAASKESADEARRAAVEEHGRYQSDVSLAQIDAAQKWLAQRQELRNTLCQQQQAHANRSRDAYRDYLNAVKAAWQSLDTKQLSPGQLQYIIRLTDEVAWQAWHSGAAS